MSLFSRLFGGPTPWNVRSLDDLVESRAVRSTPLPWNQPAPSELAVGRGVAAVVVDHNVLIIIDPAGAVLSTFRSHEKPITAIAVSPDGEWVASAEEDARAIVIRATRAGSALMFDTSGPVSALAFGPDTLYAGTRTGVMEVHPFDAAAPGETARYEFTAKIFDEPPSVSWLDASAQGRRVAFIAGGALFVWDGAADGAVDVTMTEGIEFMAARFSPDGRHLAAAGGNRDALITFGDGGVKTTFKNPRGLLYLKDLERKQSVEAHGQGYWIQNVFWSASGEGLLCFPSIAPPGGSAWIKALTFHRTDSVRAGHAAPESVTRLPTAVDTSSAGIMAPGQLLMASREGGIVQYAVGEDYAPPASPALPASRPAPHTGQQRATSEPTLDAIVVVFSRDFPQSGQFVDEILTQLTTRGRTYRAWMRGDTPVRVKIHANAQDQTTVAAIALVEFRRLGIEGADLARVQAGTFEGSQGIVGSVLSHWS